MEIGKVKEIKKALEFQRGVLMYLENNCAGIVHCKDILTLINELESENDCKDIEISKQEYQIEKLKDRIAELEKEKRVLAKQIVKITSCSIDDLSAQKECKDKLKQFAERLKEKRQDAIFYINACQIFSGGVSINNIDETLEEFIDEK